MAPAARPRRWRRWAAAAALLVALAAAVAFFVTRPPPEVRLGRRVQLTLDPGLEIDPALSPDGAFVAFVAGPLGRTRLYVRQADGGAPVAITPEGGGFARVPRWAPDQQYAQYRGRYLWLFNLVAASLAIVLLVAPSYLCPGL